MRLKISLASGNGEYKIPFNYNYQLSSLIYRKIADLDLASDLHISSDFKFFTFSQIYVPRRRITKNGIISRDGKLEFYISSPNDYLIKSMVESYLEDPQVTFRGDRLLVEQVELLKKPEFKKSARMKTMSPVMARTKRDDKIWDLNPGDRQFYTALQGNLLRKYRSFYGDYNGDEYVQIVPDMGSVKRKRITIKKDGVETYHRAYQMYFNVEADSKLLEFMYDSGLGEKNSMGFGMVEKSLKNNLNSRNKAIR
jgi:CRISPR-associated endoribonuclease Cas6